MRIVAALAAAGAAALAAAAPVCAQEPGERAWLDSVRASFAALEDTTVLAQRERDRIAVARTDRDNPRIHMELGYLAYRLGELTGARKRYQDAASEFQWAADLRPGWPYAWYNLGLAELGTGEARALVLENIRQMLGQDFLSQAVRSFARALEADPGFSYALVDLATVALRQRVQPRLVVAQAVLRQAAGTDAGRVPSVQLMRGRIERRVGDFDSALVAFGAYLRTGGDSAIGHLELARTQAQFGRVDSTVAEYRRAARGSPSDSARAELRRDIRWIAEPQELAAYDALPPDSVGPWLQRFWDSRDAVEGRRRGERLTEQLRRWQYAVENFALVSRHRAFDVALAYADTAQAEVDDRGIVYLRHGEPSERVASTGAATWLYRRTPPERDLILNFIAVGDVQDYRLVESLRQVCAPSPAAGPNRPVIGVTEEEAEAARTRRLYDEAPLVVAQRRQQESVCVLARSDMSETYARLARGGSDVERLWSQERAAGRAQVREAVRTDSYPLRFDEGLAPVMSWFAVADAAQRPELHVVFAVPAARLHELAAEGASAYMLELRLEVYDSTRRPLASLDTLRVFRSAQRLGGGQYLTAQVTLGVPPGHLLYTFVAAEPHSSAGTAVANQPLDVPRFDGGFGASDVVLGREGSGLVWRRAEGEVPLNPLMTYPRDGTVTLYYELYGLPQSASVATRVRIAGRGRSVFRRIFGGGGGAADLAYTTVTDAPARSRVRQHLELRGLGPGRYVLEVELTDPLSGRRLVRRSPFEIEGRRAP